MLTTDHLFSRYVAVVIIFEASACGKISETVWRVSVCGEEKAVIKCFFLLLLLLFFYLLFFLSPTLLYGQRKSILRGERERGMHENYKIMLQRGVEKLFVMSFGGKKTINGRIMGVLKSNLGNIMAGGKNLRKILFL